MSGAVATLLSVAWCLVVMVAAAVILIGFAAGGVMRAKAGRSEGRRAP